MGCPGRGYSFDDSLISSVDMLEDGEGIGVTLPEESEEEARSTVLLTRELFSISS